VRRLVEILPATGARLSTAPASARMSLSARHSVRSGVVGVPPYR
jgi:hypothetical protein